MNKKTLHILRPCINDDGYVVITLSKDDKSKVTIPIHSLMGKIFLNLSERLIKELGLTVDHIDRIRKNNHISNLRLATKSEQNLNQGKRTRTVK